mgnify:FL=1
MNQQQKDVISRVIGARIAYYRNILGMTQKELANRLTISPSTIAKIEQGKYGSSMSIYYILDLSEIFGVAPSALMHVNEQDKELVYGMVYRHSKLQEKNKPLAIAAEVAS